MALPAWYTAVGAIRTDINPAAESLGSAGHSAQHNRAAEALEAIAERLGEWPGSGSSVYERVEALAGGAARNGFVYVTNHDTDTDAWGKGDFVAEPGGAGAAIEAASQQGNVIIGPSGPAGYTFDAPGRLYGRHIVQFPWHMGPMSSTSVFPEGRYLLEVEDITAPAMRPVDQTVVRGFVQRNAASTRAGVAGGILLAVQHVERLGQGGWTGYPDMKAVITDCYFDRPGREMIRFQSYNRTNRVSPRVYNLWVGTYAGTPTATATAGTVKIRLNKSSGAQVTAALSFASGSPLTAATVKAALEALPGIGSGNITATGGPLPSAAIQITLSASAFTSIWQSMWIDIATKTLTGAASDENWYFYAPTGGSDPAWGADVQSVLLDNVAGWNSGSGFAQLSIDAADCMLRQIDVGRSGTDAQVVAVDTVNKSVTFNRADVGFGLVKGDVFPFMALYSYASGGFYDVVDVATTSTQTILTLDEVTGLNVNDWSCIVSPGVRIYGDNISILGHKVWNVRGPGIDIVQGRGTSIQAVNVLDCRGDGIYARAGAESPVLMGNTVRNAGRKSDSISGLQMPGVAAYRIGAKGATLSGQAMADVTSTDYMLVLESGAEVYGQINGTGIPVALSAAGAWTGLVTVNGEFYKNGTKVNLGGPSDTNPPTVPGVPTPGTITITSAVISWTASTDTEGTVDSYKVYRDAVHVASTDGLTFTDTGLSAATAYKYAVSAVDDSGNESAKTATLTVTTLSGSPTDVTAPTVPGSLAVSGITSSGMSLSWTASTDAGGLAGYRVYRNGGASPVATPTGTSYSASGLSAATAYTWQVSAIDNAGNESAKTTAVSASTLAAGTYSRVNLTVANRKSRGRVGGSTGWMGSNGSGMVAARTGGAGKYLINNDHSNNTYWLVTPSASGNDSTMPDSQLQQVTFGSGFTVTDLEDASYGPDPFDLSRNVVFLWDCGGTGAPAARYVNLFSEPASGVTKIASADLTRYRFQFRTTINGSNLTGVNCESIFVDSTGVAWAIEKVAALTSRIFVCDMKTQSTSYGKTGDLTDDTKAFVFVDTGKTFKSAYSSGTKPLYTLAADIHPTNGKTGGKDLVVVSLKQTGSDPAHYRWAFYWRTAAHSTWADALSVTPHLTGEGYQSANPTVQWYDATAQGKDNQESCAFSVAGDAVWSTSDLSASGNPSLSEWPLTYA